MKQFSINIDDKEYKYVDSLKGGKTLIILHGMGGNKETMIPVTQVLRDNFRCIYLDLPGHSNIPLYNMDTLDQQSLYIIKLLNYLKTENFGILGFSFGGNIAIKLIENLDQTIPLVLWASPSTGKVRPHVYVTLNHGKIIQRALKSEKNVIDFLRKLGMNYRQADIDGIKHLDPNYFEIADKLLKENLVIPADWPVLSIMDENDHMVIPDMTKYKSMLIPNGCHNGSTEGVEKSLTEIVNFFENNL